MDYNERSTPRRWGDHTPKFEEAFKGLMERDDDGWGSDYQVRLAYSMDLEKLAVELMGRRQDREARWIDNARQYAGIYDPATLSSIRKRPGASELFVNMTRPKTTVLRSRITDVMLPEDTTNWDIQSSPVPDLPEWALQEVQAEVLEEAQKIADQKAAEAAEEAAAAMEETEGADPQAAPPMPEPPDLQTVIAEMGHDFVFQFIKKKSEEIVDRARLVMTDQLRESQYEVELFKLIHEGCKYGTGVIKGPLVGHRTYKRWMKQQLEDGSTAEVRTETSRPAPEFMHVHCWDLYADPEASSIEDAEYAFELHRWSRKQLRTAARSMGFNHRAVRQLLRENPRLGAVYDSFHETLREIEGDYRNGKTTRYHVWEYRGPADLDGIRNIGGVIEEMGDEGAELAQLLGMNEEDYDPLKQQNIVVYVCQGHLLSFELEVLDTNELPYSIFTLDPDESTLYGEGVPGIVEHPQRALNAAWRLAMDTGALSGLPMFVIDDSIEAVDGRPEIRAGKLWRRTSNATTTNIPPIEVVQIGATVADSLEIAGTARQLMNDESMIPLVAHGDTSGAVQQTAHGMTLLSNAVNTSFRQIVRAIDLNVTTPVLKRLYQWNRQFGPEFIDGDMQIMALGSSVLLVREVQAGQRMTMLNLVSQDPELGDHVNKEELVRLLSQAMQLPSDTLLYDRETAELRRADRLASEREMAQIAGREKLEAEQLRQAGIQDVETRRQETEMARLQAQLQIAREKLASEEKKARLKARSDERKLSVEIMSRRLTGQGV